MASTGIDLPGKQPPPYPDKFPSSEDKKQTGIFSETDQPEAASIGVGDRTHRKLKSRHIQLIGNDT